MASHGMPITFKTPTLYERDLLFECTAEGKERQDPRLLVTSDRTVGAPSRPLPAILHIPQKPYVAQNQPRDFAPQDPIRFLSMCYLRDFVLLNNGPLHANERPFEVGGCDVPDKVHYRLGFYSVGRSHQHMKCYGKSKNAKCTVEGRRRSITRLRVVQDVVKVVAAFFHEHGNIIICRDEMGAEGPRTVEVEDLVLLEIRHVSPGSWQPIFALINH